MSDLNPSKSVLDLIPPLATSTLGSFTFLGLALGLSTFGALLLFDPVCLSVSGIFFDVLDVLGVSTVTESLSCRYLNMRQARI